MKFDSLSAFYPYYLTEHSNSICRTFHFVGTAGVIILAVLSVVTLNWRFAAFMPVFGYGFAWMGHFIFERNKPAAFKNPWYSLASDFIMFWHTITGQLKGKVEESARLYPKS